MPEEDHLDKEVSVAAEATPTGVKASAKSRFISGLDRLGGNITELLNVPIERRTAVARAKMEGEKKLIEAAAQYGIERMKHDPTFAARAIENHFEGIFTKQERKDRVLAHAAEALENEPPSDAESTSGDEKLSDAFLNRFERYAEEATTEEIQEKWGRVLAGEVRKPGTFSGKVMRVIDELDSQTASIFEDLCEDRIGSVVPKVLSGELIYPNRVKLVDAGLLVEPGLGQHQKYTRVSLFEGQTNSALRLDRYVFVISDDATVSKFEENAAISGNSGNFAVPIYILTEVGSALTAILTNAQQRAAEAYAQTLADSVSTAQATLISYDLKTESVEEIKTFQRHTYHGSEVQ